MPLRNWAPAEMVVGLGIPGDYFLRKLNKDAAAYQRKRRF